ncbi:acyltransferase family protein [Novosphingobium umbonatum]|nr:acyltransferase [Novosphingobium umbonatum]
MTEQTAPSSAPSRLLLLDALRGLAAVAVMFHHEPILYGSAGYFPRAYLAVDFFFMLSGYVLTFAFEGKMQQGLRADLFLVQRLARLWPVLAVGILIGALGRWWVGVTGHLWFLTLASLALLPVLRGRGGIYQLDGPQWSVTFEILANYVHALLLWRLSNRRLLAFVLACGALLAWQTLHWGAVTMGDITRNWWGGFARVGFSYGLGIWMARQAQAGRGRLNQGIAWAGALLVPIALCTAPLWPLGVVAGDMLAVFVLLPPALWCAAQVRLSGVSARSASVLGKLSYPLYAVHGPVLIFGALLVRYHGASPDVVRPLAILATFALGLALAYSPLARGFPLRLKPKRG